MVDFGVVGRELGVRVTESGWLSKTLSISREEAMQIWERMGRLYCDGSYDYIVVIDTIAAGGRPFMEAARAEPAFACAVRRIIFLATQRFDFAVEGDPSYIEAFRAAVGNPLFLVAQNSPYEEWYMAQRGVALAAPLRTLPPHGFIPPEILATYQPAPKQRHDLPAVLNYPAWAAGVLLKELEDADIDYALVQRKEYGGPAGLARFKAFVHLPYQVSVMSLYENLAAGVIYIVPSAALMTAWCKDLRIPYPDDTSNGPRCGAEGFPWDRVDFYGPRYARFILKFDSFQQLRRQLEVEDFAALSREAVAFMQAHRQHALESWREMLV